MKTGWYYCQSGLYYDGIKYFKKGKSEELIDWHGPFRTFEACKQDAIDKFEWDRKLAEAALRQLKKTKKPRTGKVVNRG